MLVLQSWIFHFTVVLYMGIFLGPRHMVRLYPVMCSVLFPMGNAVLSVMLVCTFICLLFVWENKPQIPRSFMYSSILVIKLTFFFWLKYSLFTMLLLFLLYSKKVAKSYIYVHYFFFFPNCLPSCFNPRETHILDLELAFIKPIIITLCTYMPGHCQGRWS